MKVELDFQDITQVGLPILDESNTSVVFLWDGNLLSGWPVDDNIESGKAIPLEKLTEIVWEGDDFCHCQSGTGAVAGVRYWSYIPETIKNLWIPDIETTWMYQNREIRGLLIK